MSVDELLCLLRKAVRGDQVVLVATAAEHIHVVGAAEAIGTGDVFSKGRDFGAWLGLVPKQLSTGDRTILGKISRRGNRYLRVLFVQAVPAPDRGQQATRGARRGTFLRRPETGSRRYDQSYNDRCQL